MSTRCQIGFYEKKSKKHKDFEALIYRHSDGYPGTACGVLADIVPFLKWWKKQRGLLDSEYVAARLLQYLCNEYDKRTKKYEKKYPTSSIHGSKKYTGVLGHGICKDFHGDIEYLYKIYPNAVEVYKVLYCKKIWERKGFTLIKTIKI